MQPPPPPPPVVTSPFEAMSSIAPPPPISWTDEQRAVLDKIDDWFSSDESFYSLTGPAGVGKSTLLREVVVRYPGTLTAMTGKAALRLAQCTGQSVSTLHAAMYWPPKPGEDLRFTRLRDQPIPAFVLIDECSMVTPSVFAHLDRWGVRALLVGDSFQLPPVITDKLELETFGEDYSVFAHVRGAELKTVMRNAGGVLRAATKVRETGEICAKSDMENGDGYEYARESEPLQRAVEDYLADRDDHILITWRNAARMTANKIIRDRLGREGPLPDEGEPVLIKRNGQGFLNGEIVTCGGFEDGPMIGSLRYLYMRIGSALGPRLLVSVQGGNPDRGGEFFDGQAPWVDDWKRYHIDLKKLALPEPTPITFGYAVTCHAAQGSEARRVTVFLERGDDRSRNFRKPTTLPSGEKTSFASRWTYTATTRSKKRTTMIVGR